ncbi:glycoside hydrolase family 97 C-terminal domain-containing protein [Mucilaginibacter sp. KACC 22773]|nr:glycoside hydrolase family 97 C-terminal domain-containing protein [Mucilaginibacter sp. KACC 22773]WDF81447.1 glycoside hydrolase family 97 C-terminal domain-containing protein [Mucilaginibacter sp. KACC 22773]
MVVIARRKGKLWYVAGLNGKDTPQTLNLNFNFLGLRAILSKYSKTE